MASYGYFEKQNVKIGTRDIYETKTKQVRKHLGYERVGLMRPKFVYFEFTGLKPDTPHWLFFDNMNINNYVNTDFTEEQFLAEPKGSSIRNPGEKYYSETAFPADKGGPTNGGAGQPLTTTTSGTLSGYFFIQMNGTRRYNTGTTVMTAIDISVPNKNAALSYAQTNFKSFGIFDVGAQVEETYDSFVRTEDVYQQQLVEVPPPATKSSGSGKDNNWTPTFYAHYEPDYGTVTYFDTAMTHEDIMKERANAGGNFFGHEQDEEGNEVDEQKPSSGCCFIMLEARYGNGVMDDVVRRYRDEYMTDRNRRGYYKLAEVLVPIMRKSTVFKWVITKTFADPLVSYGKYYYGQNKHGWIFTPVKNFWMKLFDVLGGETEFVRENGETV